MENNKQNNKEKRCIICNRPYNYHYDIYWEKLFNELIYTTKYF